MDKLQELRNERTLLNTVDIASYELYTEKQITELLDAFDKGKAEAANFMLACIQEPTYYTRDAMNEYRKFRQSILDMEMNLLSDAFEKGLRI